MDYHLGKVIVPDNSESVIGYIRDYWRAIDKKILLYTIESNNDIKIILTQEMFDSLNEVRKKHDKSLYEYKHSFNWSSHTHKRYLHPINFIDIWELKRNENI